MALLGRHPPRVTDSAPHIRGLWSVDRISLVFLLALMPPLGVMLYRQGNALVPPVVLSLAVVLVWQGLFAWIRRRPMFWHGPVTALTFALMVPVDAPLWQLALALSFGVVVGEQIFGGHGRNFLNPTVVAIAFLIFSFPGGGYEAGAAPPTLYVLPGAILLIATRVISGPVMASAIFAYMAWQVLLGLDEPTIQLPGGAFAFALFFLACDPVASASTDPGRWIYGTLVAGLAVLIQANGAGDGTVFAILIASIFAPLIDQAVIYIHIAWRRRRDARL